MKNYRLFAASLLIIAASVFQTPKAISQPLELGFTKDSLTALYPQLETPDKNTDISRYFDYYVADVYWAGLVGKMHVKMTPNKKVKGFVWSSAVKPKQVRPFIEMLGKKFGGSTGGLVMENNQLVGVMVYPDGKVASVRKMETPGGPAGNSGAIAYHWPGGKSVVYDHGVISYSEGVTAAERTMSYVDGPDR